MSYKDKYIKRNDSYNAYSLKNVYINDVQNTVLNSFLDNPSAKEVYLNDNTESTWVWIVEDTKTPTTKKIIMKPNDTIEAGWIVNWNNENWICISADHSKDVYQTGFIEKCNANLKWKDESGTIHSYPCIFYYGTKANFGTYSDKVMTLPDGRRQVVVQKNEHTIKIKRDVRFIFGGSVFKVIDFDYVSEEGLVNLNLKDDQFNPATDNLELGIADYYTSENEDTTPSLPVTGLTLVIKSTSTTPYEIRKNQQKEYFIEVYDGSTLVPNETVTWQLFADDRASSTTLATITSQTGTNCIVKNNGAISGYVQLKATLNSDNTVIAWSRIQMKSLF